MVFFDVAVAVFLSFVLISVFRLIWILPFFRAQSPLPRRTAARLLVVLGSGGHTAEMLRLLQPLDFNQYTHRSYVVSSGDVLSEGKAFELEKQKKSNRK